ncbi:MAG TPA: hypothetical protein VGR78_09125 [Verrucomicrobiae bacterium]|nr:hypothetical protein [Verrucomicrobiae bacterium]
MLKALIRRLAGKEDDERLPLKERFLEALAFSEDSSAVGSEIHETRVHLEKAMSSVENLIHQAFLGD